MRKSVKGSKLDNVGMTASVLCAIHCAVVPFLITSLPLLGLGFLANPWVEWSMILFAVIIGFYAIGSSYAKVHKRVLPIILLIMGFAIIIAGHLFVHSWREAIIVPVGGLIIATAHFFNYRYNEACHIENGTFHLGHAHRH